jgi:uroporphyrin-3 C-methyltransferase
MTSLKNFSENFITFRTRDGSAIPLLSPEQHFYLRENLKAKLATAIKAVYDEQQELYTTSLKTAQEWSSAYLSLDDNDVKQFNQAIGQLADQKIDVTYPVKLESQRLLADVINERLRREVTSIIKEEN